MASQSMPRSVSPSTLEDGSSGRAAMRPTNGLGIAGLFLSIIGLIVPTGVVAIVGMMLSGAALGRAPRGAATIGLTIGIVGTVLWLVIDLLVVLGVVLGGVAAVIGFAFILVLTQPEIVELTSDMTNVAIAVEHERERSGDQPWSLEDLDLSPAAMIDPWGQPYVLAEGPGDAQGFDVVSGGPDGVLGTTDDVRLSRLPEAWETAMAGFGERLEAFGERVDGMQAAGSRDGNGSFRFVFSDLHEDGRVRVRVDDSAWSVGAECATSPAPSPDCVIEQVQRILGRQVDSAP